MTRQQIKENRLKFAHGLLEPHRVKHKGQLENRNNPNSRCCIGHGCDIFNLKRGVNLYNDITFNGVVALAPLELEALLGLYGDTGGFGDFSNSLAQINDSTDLTTQQIGELILSSGWIEGGADTPFKPLTDYPEE